MKTVWTKGLTDPKDIKNRKELVLNSKFALDILRQICYNMVEESRKSKKIDYDNPAWAYAQADKLGYVRALEDIITILQIDPEETK